VEQRHYRFKKSLDQALMLRGSRDFAGREDYEAFLAKLFEQLNAGRTERLREELQVLGQLPWCRRGDHRDIECQVSTASTIRVLKNTYSVHSRLIGRKVRVRIYAEFLEIWYGQRKVEQLTRLRGENGHLINYRHIIDWLVRKPGAFEHYRYKQDLFPSSYFRMVYDLLVQEHGLKSGTKQYHKLLELAAKESETAVNETLHFFLSQNMPLSFEAVEAKVCSAQQPPPLTDVYVEEVDLAAYDRLLDLEQVLS
jgi:hypothetical protein